MCGIAGVWLRSGQPVDLELLERMTATLVHRGPDGSGHHVDGEIGLANRRLRILDTRELADQPMALPEHGLRVTFNGEIHNYLELASELRRHGATFRTRSDTEVVLWAYAIWGTACFERFNGMWALALWDANRRELILCRDRFGIKPLYYSERGDRVCFASEPKAILAAFPREREVNHDELTRFLAGGYPDTGSATFFANIAAIEPGVCARLRTRETSHLAYWSFVPGRETAQPDTAERFRDLLSDAVGLRARSDVPIGACLSGGLDSSAIVSLLSPRITGPIDCFSARYDDPAHDESHYAALAARHSGARIHWVRPDPAGMLDVMRNIVWHHDAPTPVRGRLAQWFVMREAGRHVKVVLDGQGSDELLAGYVRDTLFYLADRLRRRSPGARGLAAVAREGADLAQLEASWPWYLISAPRRYRRDPRDRGERPFSSRLNNVLWNGLRRHGLPEVLHAEDAMSMAFSVESRTPFLDHRLVEFCFSLPFDEKIRDGWTKSALRRSMAGTVPDEILARRRKIGFSSPIATWFRLPDNRRAFRELLLDGPATERGLIPRRSMERELTAFERGPIRYARQRAPTLWRWITAELWFRDFIDPGARAIAPPTVR